MVDLHSHILPGLDDGAASLDEALQIVRDMAAEGIRIVAATPHVSERYPTTADAMEAALELVRAAVSVEGLEIDVRGGGELTAENASALEEDELARFGLGGNPRALLVECPYQGWSNGLVRVLDGLLARGIWAVLAHPERNPVVQQSPRVLAPLVESGVLIQLTAASLDGRLGRASAKCAQTLLREGLAHMIASDAHAPTLRAGGLIEAVEAVGNESLAHWLVEDVPAAVVNGETPPNRPTATRRRRNIFR
jgi:protein-tyrosine phosphatase